MPRKSWIPKKEKRRRKEDDWREAKPLLKEEFIKAGIYSCELGYEGCQRQYGWTFAHSKKQARIFKPSTIVTPKNQHEYEQDMLEVIWACMKCHMKLEKVGNKQWKSDDSPTMIEIVREKINKRLVQPEITDKIYEQFRK